MCETIQNLAGILVSLETVEVILDQTSKYSSKIPEYWSIIKRNLSVHSKPDESQMHYASERSQIQKATYYDSINVEHL